MQIGRYRNEIIIKQRTLSRGATGQSIETWAILTTVWGEINSAYRGEEKIRRGAHQRQSVATYYIRIRYRTDITSKHQVEFGGQTYQIINVLDESGLQKETVLFVKEDQSE